MISPIVAFIWLFSVVGMWGGAMMSMDPHPFFRSIGRFLAVVCFVAFVVTTWKILPVVLRANGM